jgi:hypothetical protein
VPSEALDSYLRCTARSHPRAGHDDFLRATGIPFVVSGVPVGSEFSATPVAADGKIYLGNEDGAIAIVAADRTFRHIATNDIGEPIMATPALSRVVLFVRTMKGVFAIGRKR